MEISSNHIWEKLSELAKSKKKPLKGAAKATGVSEGAISGWKKSFPTVDNLAYLAEYYGVSLDYLVFGEKPDPLEEREESLLYAFNQLNDNGKKAALRVVRGLIEDFPLQLELAGELSKTAT